MDIDITETRTKLNELVYFVIEYTNLKENESVGTHTIHQHIRKLLKVSPDDFNILYVYYSKNKMVLDFERKEH